MKTFLLSVIATLFLFSNSIEEKSDVMTAINQGIPDIEKRLSTISIHKRYPKNKTLLHYAVQTRDFKMVSFLVNRKILLSIQGGVYNNTALQDAIAFGYFQIATYLIKKGTPLNIKNKYGNTALHIASSRGYLNTVKLLLASGADKHIINNQGKTPCELIPNLTFGNIKEIKKILQTKIKPPKRGTRIKIDNESQITNSIIGIKITKEE